MPVTSNFEIHKSSKDEFHQAAKIAIGIAFDLQNQRGRFLKEWNYQLAMRNRLMDADFQKVIREAEIVVQFGDFQKSFFLDLIADSMLVIELKSKANLTSSDEAQLLQYLVLLGISDGLLLNLGSPRVQKRFVSTMASAQSRRQLEIQRSRWRSAGCGDDRLMELSIILLQDWGTGLHRSVYLEAMIHCLGGFEHVCREVAVYDANQPIGHIQMNLIDDQTAFTFMTAKPDATNLENSLHQLIRTTSLKRLHWINLFHDSLSFTTLER